MKYKLILIATMFIGVLASCKKEVNHDIIADFTTSAQTVNSGGSVTFTDASIGQPSTWTWSFEGGTPSTSNLSSPTVVYNQPGTYSVTLEVKNAFGQAIQRKESFIKVDYNNVNVDFDSSVTSLKQGETVTFTDKTSGMPTTWQWEFKSATGTTLTSAQQNPAITFTVPGVYTVTLKASNPKFSGQIVKTSYINVIDITAVEAAFESNTTATYTGGTINFTDKSIGTVTSYSWTFEGGNTPASTAKNPSVTYATPGRYSVKLVATNTAKSSTVEKTAYILVVPGDNLTAFYPFNNSIDDFGPGKITSVKPAASTITFDGADRKSQNNNVAVFNATGGFVVPDNNAFNFGTGDYSVSCWIKTSSATRGMIWMESGAKGSGDNQTWLRLLGSATNLTSFSTEDASGGSTINLTAAANGSVATTYDGVWHHIVCVREGLVSRIYIDGVKVRELSSTTGLKTVSNDAAFKVGMQEGATGFSNFYTGFIDDLIVYKKALTQAEVNALFNL